MSDYDDSTMTRLAHLPAIVPSAARAQRVRARCHDLMARQRQRAERRARVRATFIRALEPALVAGFGLVYLLAVALKVAAIR